MSGPRSLVIHAHLYQPPRENPWTGVVDPEPTAAPHHDWNARITAECYAPLVAARVERPGAPTRTVNLLASLSFDVGPTLLEWMEREAPAVYAGVLEADRASRDRLGHGNAIAMPYHHVILPLASRRDKQTEIRWGIADFQRRFGRAPEGFWLPETAVDHETLDVLAAEGIAFTVLAPHQVAHTSRRGLPERYRASGGRSIALFPYDGPLSHGVAFGGLLRDATVWADEILSRTLTLVSLATDGETYGHHHKFADLALAALLERLSARDDVRVENYASFLSRHAPRTEATLVAPSSWSCAHGVGRWQAECGCRLQGGTQQRWRAPLRSAVAWLAAEVDAIFVREWPLELGDAWVARDAFGAPFAEVPASVGPQARELLLMERNALRAFTSCGWFFDDFGGLEGRQVLRYAARAIDLAGVEAERLEAGLLARLADAPSNDPAVATAKDLYLRSIVSRRT